MAVILFWCLAAAQEAPERLPPAPISAEEAPAAAPTDLGEVATEGEEPSEETQGEEGLDLPAAEGEGGEDSGLSEEEVQLWETPEPDERSSELQLGPWPDGWREVLWGRGYPLVDPLTDLELEEAYPDHPSIGLDAPLVSPLGLELPPAKILEWSAPLPGPTQSGEPRELPAPRAQTEASSAAEQLPAASGVEEESTPAPVATGPAPGLPALDLELWDPSLARAWPWLLAALLFGLWTWRTQPRLREQEPEAGHPLSAAVRLIALGCGGMALLSWASPEAWIFMTLVLGGGAFSLGWALREPLRDWIAALQMMSSPGWSSAQWMSAGPSSGRIVHRGARALLLRDESGQLSSMPNTIALLMDAKLDASPFPKVSLTLQTPEGLSRHEERAWVEEWLASLPWLAPDGVISRRPGPAGWELELRLLDGADRERLLQRVQPESPC